MAKEKIQKPIVDEVASVARDPFYYGYIGDRLLNPDEILANFSKGKGIDLYDDLERDDQIYNCKRTRVLAVTKKNWQIIPASEKRADIRISDYVEAVFKNIPNFDQDIEQLLDAVIKGWACSELMPEASEGDVCIADIRSRKQNRFFFDKNNQLRLVTKENPVDGELMPPMKFLTYAFNSKYENPYGNGLGQQLYWPWWFKKHGIKFWMLFLEKFGSPTPAVKYPDGSDPKVKEEALKVARAVQQDTGIALPMSMVIELLEAARTSSVDAYYNAAGFFDAAMAKILVGQTLTSSEGRFGTQALGSVHLEILDEITNADCDQISQFFNNTLVKWIVDWNFGPQKKYPEFWKLYEKEKDLKVQAERDNILVNMGLKIPAHYAYDEYNIPQPEEGEELLTPAVRGSGLGISGAAQFAESQPPAKAKQFLQENNNLADAAAAAGMPVIEKLTGNMAERLKKKSAGREINKALLFDNQDRENLAMSLFHTLMAGNLLGRWQVNREVQAVSKEFSDRLVARAPGRLEFSEYSFSGLPPEEAINYLRSKVPMNYGEYMALEDALKKSAFSLAEAELESLASMVQDALRENLARGLTEKDFFGSLTELFYNAGLSPLNPYRAATIYQTNIMDALAQGREALYNDPQVKDYFPYFQYHTAGDAKVRLEHKKMNGFTAKADDPIWNIWTPYKGIPWQWWNCRCIRTAISKYEAEAMGLC